MTDRFPPIRTVGSDHPGSGHAHRDRRGMRRIRSTIYSASSDTIDALKRVTGLDAAQAVP
ncbi:hypothetical protein [Jannaschia aquimarina]|uniref:Uncharacterized protein n=1 Tax=Jannaschia aquimarina TaxID=935700 RepID=A0A0D1CI89_9RHOB|nr:hypothetical protein [Jannaschia aquimarina]KIT14397.1 hypothetical protein jaqu_38920 [Jannaschia aquimarina]SNT42558.1 hypothetical protein SAMN05421775_1203 [Jannaschia aquimarina]